MKAFRLFQTIAIVGTLISFSMVPADAALQDQKLLDPTAQSTDWSTTSLIPVDFSVGVQEITPARSAKEIVAQHSGVFGSIVFVVRRPG